ncbi:MAG TPA: DUF2807 domain-containing protein [Rhizomicrobium sp.]|jgi:hypothetical protein|nr:DUF2807 domain-containing protein [Rhizomicrobium sp.]
MVSRLLALSALLACTASAALAPSAVPVGRFDSVELRGGGHVVLRHGAVQSVTITQGSTQFTTMRVTMGGKLEIDACNRDCPERYDLQITIVTPDIRAVAVSGGGHIESEGDFPDQHQITAAVQGGGNVDLRSIDAANGTAAVDGGGKIQIKAEKMLTAAVNGGGHITYWGEPSLTSAVSGGGGITKGS